MERAAGAVKGGPNERLRGVFGVASATAMPYKEQHAGPLPCIPDDYHIDYT